MQQRHRLDAELTPHCSHLGATRFGPGSVAGRDHDKAHVDTTTQTNKLPAHRGHRRPATHDEERALGVRHRGESGAALNDEERATKSQSEDRLWEAGPLLRGETDGKVRFVVSYDCAPAAEAS